MTLTRRQTLSGLGLGLGLGIATGIPVLAQKMSVRIVIIGGGFGGASSAQYLKHLLPNADITLVESNANYVACPFSNLVIGGDRDIADQTFGYAALKALGVNIIHAYAKDVDPIARTVQLAGDAALRYDKLILSPGIDMRWNALEGYDEAAAEIMPHAWKAGAQTLLLRKQLEKMENGGLVVMSAPPAPFRCPPGPYERASLIAHYLKTHKPKSKLIILDAKDSFSKMPLFKEAWAELYPEHLEWRAGSFDGRVTRVDTASRTLVTDFDELKPAVANVIPPQKAGEIARRAGVADDTGWCPIHPLNFESRLHKHIHVIGDATVASPMPKSAFSANLQAKIAAISIAQELNGTEITPTTLVNTCYSYTAPDEAVSIVGVYHNSNDELTSVKGAGGLSPLNAEKSIRQTEAQQAKDWFATIAAEAFG